MSANIEEAPLPTTSSKLEMYASYPFASDETYQQGLATLIAEGAIDAAQPPDVREELLLRTRVFYFNRVTGHIISMDDAREYEHSINSLVEADTTASPAVEETRVLTFVELQELIETGKVDQIPNNKTIPDALNDAAPSESTAVVRKKPWESIAVEA